MKNKAKMKNFETGLPEGYREVYAIDAAEKRIGLIFNTVALALAFVIGIIIFAAIDIESYFEMLDKDTFLIYWLILVVGMIVYIVAHELVHGAAYKLLTHRKLTFGLKWSCAYCGVPDIYVYRRASLISLLAPFVVFNIVFLLPMIFWTGSPMRLNCCLWFIVHNAGCVGDLYVAILYLTKFRSPAYLMRDTGPKQTFYINE